MPRMWIVDCFMLDAESAAKYELPFAYLDEHVRKMREQKPRSWYRAQWWQLYAQRPEMRKALDGLTRFIVTARVSKHRLFAWQTTPISPDCQLIVFARSDDLFFGILHSRFHEVWALRMGTRLETRPRYTPTTCFETFPFPPGVLTDTRQATPDTLFPGIAAAARELNQLRENWLNPSDWTRTETLEFPGTVGGPWDRYIDPATVEDRGSFKVGTVRYPRIVPRDANCAAKLKKRTLTNLYNERPAWLAAIHDRLDAAVAAAYGWPSNLPNDTILEKLLELNLANGAE